MLNGDTNKIYKNNDLEFDLLFTSFESCDYEPVVFNFFSDNLTRPKMSYPTSNCYWIYIIYNVYAYKI